MSARSTMHADMQRQAAKQREQSQHQPRPSRVRFSVRTSGVGESRLQGTRSLDFGAFMLDEPSFSFGVVAVTPLGPGQLPQATAVVLRFIKNGNGLYTGADVAFKIACTKSDVRLKFSLTFEGTTIRSTVGTGTTTTTDAPRGTNVYSGSTNQATGTGDPAPAELNP